MLAAVGAHATVFQFSFKDLEVWDGLNDPDNVTITLDVAALLGLASGASVTIDGFGWDVSITPNGASWYSETTFLWTDSLLGQQVLAGASLGAGSTQGNGVTMDYSSGGILLLADAGLPDMVLADGLLLLQLYETFDDFPDAVDATISGTINISAAKPIPLPGAVLLLASGLLTVGAVGRRSF